MMRKSIDRLLGQRWSGVVRGYWNWWQERALEKGGQGAVREATQSYRTMQRQVQQLARAVREQELACDRAERLYLAKVKEYRACQQQLQHARQARNAEREQQALYRARRLERILPQLMDNVESGADCLQKARHTLQQEIERLETYRYQLHELVERDRANQTLSTLLHVSSPQGQTPRDRFDRAKAAIEDRQHYTQALYRLTDSPLTDGSFTDSPIAELETDVKTEPPRSPQLQSPRASWEKSESEASLDARSPAASPQPIPPLRRPKRLP